MRLRCTDDRGRCRLRTANTGAGAGPAEVLARQVQRQPAESRTLAGQLGLAVRRTSAVLRWLAVQCVQRAPPSWLQLASCRGGVQSRRSGKSRLAWPAQQLPVLLPQAYFRWAQSARGAAGRADNRVRQSIRASPELAQFARLPAAKDCRRRCRPTLAAANAAVESRERLLRADFDEHRRSLRGKLAHQVGIAHRRGQVSDQIVADFGWVADDFVIRHAVGRDPRRVNVSPAIARWNISAGAAHQRRVERAGHLQLTRFEQQRLAASFRARPGPAAFRRPRSDPVRCDSPRRPGRSSARRQAFDRLGRGCRGQHAGLSAGLRVDRLASMPRHADRLLKVPGSRRE